MKKRFLRKTVSTLLAVIMIMSASLTFFASAKNEKVNQDCPLIYVHGFMATTIYEDPDDENSEETASVSSEAILSAIKQALPSFAKFSVTRDWDALSDEIIPIAKEVTKDLVNNPDGSTPGTSDARLVYPTAEEIEENYNEIDFKYDWRSDPVEIAAELNNFIEYICKTANCSQVSLSCHSLGGVIGLSYISIYGTERIKGVAFNSTAIYGETYTGELLTGNISLNSNALFNFIDFAFDGDENESLIDSINKLFKNAGLLDFVSDFGNTIVENLSERVLSEVVAPIFAGWPTIWAMVPDEYINDAMDYVFGTVYKDSDVDRSGLVEKINSYNEKVRKNKTQTLLELDEVSRVVVISRYGYSSIPATPSWEINSDGVIDTKNTSFGATVAPYGESFDETYLSGKDKSLISPDSTVDASTCLFPEKTWFVKNLKHSDTPDGFDEMILTLLYSEEEATVNTYSEYPRFLKYSYLLDKVYADDSLAEKDSESFLAKIINFFADIIAMLKSFFTI